MSDLFDLKTFFLLGQYQAAINEGSKVRPRDDFGRIERDIYVYRAFTEQGNYQVVLDELNAENSPPPLKAVRTLAAFLSGKMNTQQTNEVLDGWMADPDFVQDDMVLLVASFIYERLGNLQKAMQCVFTNKLLEAHAMVIQILLKLRRPDLAQKELSELLKANEFAIPTLLSSACVNLALGGDKIQEALHTYEDLFKKYGPSFATLHGIGVSKLLMQNFKESEEALLGALEKVRYNFYCDQLVAHHSITSLFIEFLALTSGDSLCMKILLTTVEPHFFLRDVKQNSKSVETLVNLIVVSQHLGKADECGRFTNQLKALAPKHPYLTAQEALDAGFDTAALQFAAQ